MRTAKGRRPIPNASLSATAQRGPHKITAGRIGLLVAGMHRSGTSAVTKIVSLLGAQLPGNLMPLHVDFNASGFWESLDVVQLNDDLLAALGSSWDAVLPIESSAVPPDVHAWFERRASAIIETNFAGSAWFVLKDPRIGRLLQLWMAVVEASKSQALVIIPVRHPREVAASLHRRDGFPLDKAVHLWLRHMVDVIRSSSDRLRAIVLYDDLLGNWRSAVERMADDLHLEWPNDPKTVAPLIEQFLDGKLRHHQQAQGEWRPAGMVDSLAAELWSALMQRTGDLNGLAESIHEQLSPFELMLAPFEQDAIRRSGLAAQQRTLLAQEVTDLREGQVRAGRQLVEYEQTLADERLAHQQLQAAFDDKVRHVEVLASEVQDLRGQRDAALRHEQELTQQMQQLREQQVRAGQQLVEYEQTLTKERLAHQQLQAAFDDKVRHVEVLASEVQDLHDQRDAARKQEQELTQTLAQAQDAIEKITAVLS